FVSLLFYVCLIFSLRYQSLRKDLKALLMGGVGLYLLQIALGIFYVISGNTPLLAGLHSGGSILIFTLQVVIFYDLRHQAIAFPVHQSPKEIVTSFYSS
ncbi:MAG: hypothetical protein ACK4OO_05055, partial [bacterium]